MNCLKSTISRLCIDKWQPWYRLIIFTPKFSELFSLNFAPPLLKVQDDLNRWSKVPILITYRKYSNDQNVSSTKNELLVFHYFQFPQIWFNGNSTVSEFYWKNKNPHIKLITLQKSKSQGGLESPNFELYHLANQFKYFIEWLKFSLS